MERPITIRYYQDDIRPLVFDHDTFNKLARGKFKSKTWDIIFVDFVGYDATGSTRKLSYFDYIQRLQSWAINKIYPTKKIDLSEIETDSWWLSLDDKCGKLERIRANNFAQARYRDNIEN